MFCDWAVSLVETYCFIFKTWKPKMLGSKRTNGWMTLSTQTPLKKKEYGACLLLETSYFWRQILHEINKKRNYKAVESLRNLWGTVIILRFREAGGKMSEGCTVVLGTRWSLANVWETDHHREHSVYCLPQDSFWQQNFFLSLCSL